MPEPGLIDDAVKYGTGGLGIGAGGLFGLASLRWFIGWLTGRLDAKQARIDAEDAEIDQKWKAYRAALEGRVESLEGKVTHLETEVERCHEEKRAMAAQLQEIIGFTTGRGKAAQMGQIDLSARRVADGMDDAAAD